MKNTELFLIGEENFYAKKINKHKQLGKNARYIEHGRGCSSFQ